MSEVRPPRVFLSFAGNDRATAERLRQDLRERDIEVPDFPPGGNLVLEINRALAQSDYFVLLWSQAAVDRQWVDVEWSAAFARELRERRSFLFIVRLDRTPLPALLAARHYLDAVDNNWNDFVSKLAAIWAQDRAVGVPLLPAPYPVSTENGGNERRSIVLRVRNRALSVAHIITVPEDSTGRQLANLVRIELALPDVEERFGGTVGMRFYYQLKNFFGPIHDDDGLSKLHIADGDTIDLEVQVESFGPDGSSPVIIYRESVPTSLSPATTRSLINSAFGHLIPW